MEFKIVDGEQYLDEILEYDMQVSRKFLQFDLTEREYVEAYSAVINKLFSEGKHKFFAAVDEKGRYLGHVWVCITVDTVDYVKIAYIYDIEVKAKGIGIGSALLKKAEEFAKENDARKIVLRVEINNPALDWYKRRGYSERAVIMEKLL